MVFKKSDLYTSASLIPVLCNCLGHINFVIAAFYYSDKKTTIVDWDDFIFGLAEILQI
jgi:hypothetical protein